MQQQRNSQPHRRVCWRDLQGPRMYTSLPTRESAPEGPNLLVGSGGTDWKQGESQASGIVPSQTPPPHYSTTTQPSGLPWPIEYLRHCPLLHNRCAEKKKYDPNEWTDQNSKTTTKRLRDSQPIRSRVQNTGNQDAHRNVWVWSKNRGRSEGYAK